MRSFAGPIIFILTLFLGLFFVPGLNTPETSEISFSEIPHTDVVSNTNAAVIVSEVKNDFTAEFTELPTFAELYPDDLTYPENLIDMLDDGIFRRSEAVAKNGERWLVLTESHGTYSLQNAKASVTNLKTNNWSGDELDAKVSFNVLGKPQLAFRNIPGLKPGKVLTLFRSRGGSTDSNDISLEMSDGFKVDFNLGENFYTLRTSKGLTKDGTKVAVLVLESSEKTQVIKQIYHSEYDERDIIGSLLWAGDMDGDGKLDLYFDEFNEKGSTGTELHLSGQAEDGKLVKLAASFGLAGC